MHNKILLLLLIFNYSYSISQTRFVDAVFNKTNSKTFTYSIKNEDTLKLDIYQPAKDEFKTRPLFVIIHGGGFTTGSRNDKSIITLATNIAKKGFIVASIDYRLLGKEKTFDCNLPVEDAMKIYSRAEEDILDALVYLKTYKHDFRIDNSKIILMGSNAGAEIVLNIAFNKNDFLAYPEKYKDLNIAALISVSGALINSNTITKNNAIPSVFYHGMNDKVIPYYKGAHHDCSEFNKGYFIMDGSIKIAEKLESLNSSFLLYSYPNKEHDIFNLPYKDLQQAFKFINKVVFETKFYQAKINCSF